MSQEKNGSLTFALEQRILRIEVVQRIICSRCGREGMEIGQREGSDCFSKSAKRSFIHFKPTNTEQKNREARWGGEKNRKFHRLGPFPGAPSTISTTSQLRTKLISRNCPGTTFKNIKGNIHGASKEKGGVGLCVRYHREKHGETDNRETERETKTGFASTDVPMVASVASQILIRSLFVFCSTHPRNLVP